MRLESSVGDKDPDQEAIQELQRLKEPRFMYRHFIDGLISGNFQPMSQSEIGQMTERLFFSFQPLIPLSQVQEGFLRSLIQMRLNAGLNRRELRFLCDSLYSKQDPDKRGPTFFHEQDIEENNRKYYHHWSLKDKLRFFNDPDLWFNAERYENGHKNIRAQGNRRLKEYGFTDEAWRDLVSVVRERTGRQKLRVLDMGCGMGAALHDMKAIDPNVETHGITLEQEPAMYDADAYHYVTADRMPAAFKNFFDIIVSNVSFRYYPFPFTALRNAVLALAEGGRAQISFSYEGTMMYPNKEYMAYVMGRPDTKGGEEYEHMQKVASSEFDMYRGLEGKGFINLDISKYFGKNYVGQVVVDKRKSVDVTDFDRNSYGL